MTQAEYNRLYRKAINDSQRLTADAMVVIRKAYEEAADIAAEQVARTTARGLSELTSASWASIEAQLRAGADIISRANESATPLSIQAATRGLFDVDAQVIGEAVDAAGTQLITLAGIENLGVAVDARVVIAQATRTYGGNYTFSDRVWDLFDTDGRPIGLNGDYQYRVKNLILTGQAQGRDVIDIAKDIQLYVAEGADAVFTPGRYGVLQPGTREYRSRVSGRVDWRALRLARSEMAASIQQAGIIEGQINPGTDGLYDWNKIPGNPIDPVPSATTSGKRCIDLQRGSPYREGNVPSYNHPNCSCWVTPHLVNEDDFINELIDWEPGDGSRVDQWYQEQYLPAQSLTV